MVLARIVLGGSEDDGVFKGEDARGGCGRGAWRRSADLVSVAIVLPA